MNGNEIRLPRAHPGQQGVLQNANRLNWLAAGRRWRKSSMAMRIAVKSALAGQHVLWGAPTFDQVRIGWDETRKGCAPVVDFNQSRMTATFPTGGSVKYRSLDDPDNARGHSANGVIVDEAGDVKDEAYYEVLRPMLIDTGGWLWALGTPKGRRGFFFHEHAAAMGRDDSMAWTIPTLGAVIEAGRLVRRPHPLENPFIPFAEIEAAYRTTPERVFRQEYLAEFIEGSGSVFRNIYNCLAGATSPADHAGHSLVCGCDWGQSQDFTCYSVVCVDCHREVALDRFNQVDYSLQRGRLAALVHQWGVGYVLVETNAAGQPIFETLQSEGLPVHGFQTTAASKPPLIEALVLAFEQAEWQWLGDPVATGELEAYERIVSATTGRSSYSAPAGVHDDTVMARALALRAAQDQTAGEIEVFNLGAYMAGVKPNEAPYQLRW